MEMSVTVESALESLRSRGDCEVLMPAGLPSVQRGMNLPPDVERFYQLCGGVKLGIIEDDFWVWQKIGDRHFV